MQKSSAKYTSREIEELLESDDELPDSYNEIADIPAYLNDIRFERLEPIQFKWLHQKIENTSTQAKHTNQKSSSFNQADNLCSKNETKKLLPDQSKVKKDNMILISKGVMTRRDLFFIKSIEEFSTDRTLLWFIDFLNNKAVRPKQRSCLIEDFVVNQYSTAKEPLSDFNKRYYFKLVLG